MKETSIFSFFILKKKKFFASSEVFSQNEDWFWIKKKKG